MPDLDYVSELQSQARGFRDRLVLRPDDDTAFRALNATNIELENLGASPVSLDSVPKPSNGLVDPRVAEVTPSRTRHGFVRM